MKTLVIAPHPDDELLGCGGTILRRASDGYTVGLIHMTSMSEETGWTSDQIGKRASEIKAVCDGLGVKNIHYFPLGFHSTELDQLPLVDLVRGISKVVTEFQPTELLIPNESDAHSDHRVTFKAATACSKWFRCPSIKRIMAYETLSETDASLGQEKIFAPTIFVDISLQMEKKLALMRLYQSEIDDFPFPRSEEAIRALGMVRGAQVGFSAAEAFMLLRERETLGTALS